MIESILSVFESFAFNVEKDKNLLPNSWKKSTIDYVIYRINGEGERIPFAYIVCVNESKAVGRRYAKRMVEYAFGHSVAWLGLVVEKDMVFSFNPERKEWDQNVTVNSLKETVERILGKRFEEEIFKERLISAISSLEKPTRLRKSIADVLQKVIANDNLINEGRTVSLSFEKQFRVINEAMRNRKTKFYVTFCRYTSVDSLFRTIDGGLESMSGLAGMNDKSEGFYLDYCLDSKAGFSVSKRPQWMVDNYNKVFITSLCDEDMADELTMWRLYGGEDGDGVCLIYEADLDALRKSKEFILAPVSYGKRDNVVVQLFHLVSKLPFIDGYQFVLSHKNIWSFFVKHEDFKIEKEYRMLYISGSENGGQIEWINNKSKGIIHPIVKFERDTYPLKLKRVILGPKCSESGVNKVQLKSWLESEKLNIEVDESKINTYR